MADANESQVCLISSRLEAGRYDDSTLRLLQLLLSSSTDVHTSLHLRRSLRLLLISHSAHSLRNDASLTLTLSALHFFLRAFSLLHDLQSCLSLRYEALLLRDSCFPASRPDLRVSYSEWLRFAQDAFALAFYSVAAQACDNAALSINRSGVGSGKNLSESMSIDSIQRLKDAAIVLSSNHSVQAHAAEYSKKKNLIQKQSLSVKVKECPASISFKNGIKLQNARNLTRLRSQQLA
ncbi:hypothetical protein vseg_013279 [Gypsophila vaccaria]